MTYFFAEVTVSLSHYSPENFEKDGLVIKKHLVEANNEIEAKEKIRKHYEKESCYETRYGVCDIDVYETIT